jgi:hypothetical protein
MGFCEAVAAAYQVVPILPYSRGFQKRYFFTLAEAKAGCQLPHCMAGTQQDYASDE